MLDELWVGLQRAERSGAPQGCTGLVIAPFEIRRAWFEMEVCIRAAQWHEPRPGDILVPFADPLDVLADPPSARICDHCLACRVIDAPGAPNGALTIGYARRAHTLGRPALHHVRPPARAPLSAPQRLKTVSCLSLLTDP